MFDISKPDPRITPGSRWCSAAIASGFLIAAMVWLFPSAEAAQFHVIVLITYLIAAAGFMHIVAGSWRHSFWC